MMAAFYAGYWSGFIFAQRQVVNSRGICRSSACAPLCVGIAQYPGEMSGQGLHGTPRVFEIERA
ncbi:MAG: hypothetical protein RLN70_10815, partial [Rhodospirillaceae bacterium]